MDRLDHLPLPEFRADLERKKSGGGSGYTLPEGRSKKAYAQTQIRKAQAISHNFSKLKEQYKGRLDPHLIFETLLYGSIPIYPVTVNDWFVKFVFEDIA